jgi:hypothetical protein
LRKAEFVAERGLLPLSSLKRALDPNDILNPGVRF